MIISVSVQGRYLAESDHLATGGRGEPDAPLCVVLPAAQIYGSGCQVFDGSLPARYGGNLSGLHARGSGDGWSAREWASFTVNGSLIGRTKYLLGHAPGSGRCHVTLSDHGR